jgi:hypothetical protein
MEQGAGGLDTRATPGRDLRDNDGNHEARPE